MNGRVNSPVQFSPNYKIVEVAKRLGIKDLSQMQVTTRQIYHAVKLQTSAQVQTITFFQDLNKAKFPFGNLPQNQLQAGEALAVERAYLSILTVGLGSEIAVNDVLPVEFYKATRPLLRGDFDLQIDRQSVTKLINTTSWYAPFNKDANFGNITVDASTEPATLYAYGQSVYHFDNSFVIPPQIQFTATLTIPPINVGAAPFDTFQTYLMLNIEGLGCLFNPKANY